MLDGRVPERALQAKIVIVGGTAATLQDAHATPTSGSSQMSGPEVEANAIWTALHGNPLRDAPGWVGLACLAALGLAVPLLRLRLGLAGTLICAAALAAAAAVGVQLAFERGWIVPLIAPLLALGLGTLGTVAAGYAAEYSVRRSMTRYSARLEAEVAARTEELRATQVEVITRLSQAAESRHEETGAHLERMSRLCARLGLAAGLSEREAEELRLAALLHDVGKIGIPDAILGKPGELTEEEWDVMRAHTTVGASILAGSRSSLIQTAETIARTHHERWNGTGYPHGLRGEAIPLAGRIAAVCDVFDALITPRSYKPAWSLDRVLAHFADERGRHFDPRSSTCSSRSPSRCATSWSPQTKSGASSRRPASADICSSVGRPANRSAASNTLASRATSPGVLRKTPSRPSTQCTATSMSSCSVSGSYQVALTRSRPFQGR